MIHFSQNYEKKDGYSLVYQNERCISGRKRSKFGNPELWLAEMISPTFTANILTRKEKKTLVSCGLVLQKKKENSHTPDS